MRSLIRWKLAQEKEFEFWTAGPQIVKGEYAGIVRKYGDIIQFLEKKLGVTNEYRILDIGCGPTVMAMLFKAGRKYGIDPICHSSIKKKCEFVNAIGEYLPFQRKSFQLVLCRNVLDHSMEPDTVMSEIARVTSDTGTALVAVYTYPELVVLAKRLFEKLLFLREETHPHYFTPADFSSLPKKSMVVSSSVIIHEGRTCFDFAENKGAATLVPRVGLYLVKGLFRKLIIAVLAYLASSLISAINFCVSSWYSRELLLVLKPSSQEDRSRC